MNVSAIIVTRGNVDLEPIITSLPIEWEILTWDNGAGRLRGFSPQRAATLERPATDLSVYGRYAAIEFAANEVIYVQDDDCIVSDPQAIVAEWVRATQTDEIEDSTWWPDSLVVCNQPEPWRSNPFYKDHALVGFGAAFHRDAPERAWRRWMDWRGYIAEWPPPVDAWLEPWFLRTCDIVFTALTPRVLVDIPHTSFDYASDPDRMWRQPSHQSERQRMLDLVLQVAR